MAFIVSGLLACPNVTVGQVGGPAGGPGALYTGECYDISLIAELSGSTSGLVVLSGTFDSEVEVSQFGDAGGYDFVRTAGAEIMGGPTPEEVAVSNTDQTGFGPDNVLPGADDEWHDNYSISSHFDDGDVVRTWGLLHVVDPNGVTTTPVGEKCYSAELTIDNDF